MKIYKLKYNLYKIGDNLTIKKDKNTKDKIIAYRNTNFIFDSYNRKLVKLTTLRLEKKISVEFTLEQLESWFEENGN